MSNEAIDRQQQKISEFLRLLPLTIEIAGLCTLSGDADLWSYRGRGADGVYGTQLGFIGRRS